VSSRVGFQQGFLRLFVCTPDDDLVYINPPVLVIVRLFERFEGGLMTTQAVPQRTEARKAGPQNRKNEHNIWLDALFLAMVVVSASGLVYVLLHN
jgi:hypothetical protein